MKKELIALVVFMLIWLMWLGAFNLGFADDERRQPAQDGQKRELHVNAMTGKIEKVKNED
jgi:hypothetical protein